MAASVPKVVPVHFASLYQLLPFDNRCHERVFPGTFNCKMGRRNYDWEDKRDVCYQLYVVEKKSPKAIAEHFAVLLGVPQNEVPSCVSHLSPF